MVSPASDEFVLVFPADTIARLESFEGLRFDGTDYLAAIQAVSSFRLRPSVEMDVAFKQVVPYTLVVCGSRVLTYRRGAQSVEGRLTGARSVGIGGHVSTHDPSAHGPTYEEARDSEIAEELRIRGAHRMAQVAVLNDNSDEVGRVHFGVIYVLLLENPRVSRNEEVITELRFEDKLELRRTIRDYENWSRICIGSLDTILSAASAAAQPWHPADAAARRS